MWLHDRRTEKIKFEFLLFVDEKMSGLCYTCCPRQMRGPALKGQKMKGLGVKYFFALSSRKRSGSNTRAGEKVYESTNYAFRICNYTVRAPEVCPTMHDERTVNNTETIEVS